MALTDADIREFRERIKQITMKAGADEETAEAILNRVGVRLSGGSHAEAVAKYPDPATPSESTEGQQ